MISSLSLIVVFFISLGITQLVRNLTLKKNLLDVPNDRSSHKVSTPRGGGIGIVISFLLSIVYLWYEHLISLPLFAALAGAMLPVALVGLWDDFGSISQKWRFFVHIFAASWVVYWLQEPVVIPLWGHQILLDNYIETLLLIVTLVWIINLYNFMDGIDGLAGTEAVFVALAGGLLISGWDHLKDSLLYFYLVAATLGFLYWNWPPAKIFMGDVASGTLGIVLATFAVSTSTLNSQINIWSWAILFSLFWVDATFTLLRRMSRNEKWYSAHCSHAYQHAARKWGHLKTTNGFNLINGLWLFPLAALAKYFPNWGSLILLVSIAPLIGLAVKMDAGLSENTD